jgi:exonuclease VII small subunit
LSEIDSIVSSIEKEVFALSSKLESLKRSMEVASRLESDVSAMVVPRLAEVAVQDVRGTIRSIVLQLSDEAGRIHTQLDKIRSVAGQGGLKEQLHVQRSGPANEGQGQERGQGRGPSRGQGSVADEEPLVG